MHEDQQNLHQQASAGINDRRPSYYIICDTALTSVFSCLYFFNALVSIFDWLYRREESLTNNKRTKYLHHDSITEATSEHYQYAKVVGLKLGKCNQQRL